MKIKKIEYLIPPQDLINDALDVLVFLDDDYCTDGYGYVVEVTTPQFLSTLMEKDKNNFLQPEYPCVIVSELTNEIIQSAIQAFIDNEDNSYWLKLYHIMPSLNVEDIDKILYQKKKESIELEQELNQEID
jgi:hypothetical protein